MYNNNNIRSDQSLSSILTNEVTNEQTCPETSETCNFIFNGTSRNISLSDKIFKNCKICLNDVLVEARNSNFINSSILMYSLENASSLALHQSKLLNTEIVLGSACSWRSRNDSCSHIDIMVSFEETELIGFGSTIQTQNKIDKLKVKLINITSEKTGNILSFSRYSKLYLNISNSMIRNADSIFNVIYILNEDFSESYIRIVESIFKNSTSRLGGIIHIQNKVKGNFNLHIQECTFKDNKAEVAGSVVQIDSLNLVDKASITIAETNFINNTNQESAAGIYVYGAVIVIDHTNFINNHVRLRSEVVFNKGNFPTPTQRQGAGGAIYAHLTSKVIISKCIFKNNTATWFGGSIAGDGEIEIQDSLFENSDSFEHTTSGDILFLSGKSIISNVTFNIRSTFNNLAIIWYSSPGKQFLSGNENISVSCPKGSKLRTDMLPELTFLDDWSIVYKDFLLFCDTCPDYKYSLEGGALEGSFSKKNWTIKETVCIDCPYGGYCHRGKIGATESFWGFKKRYKNEIEFKSCQDDYCCNKKICGTYNGCSENRQGPLCGECKTGMSEVLFSPECVKNEKCNDSWFIVIEIASIFTTLLFFAYQLEILNFMMEKLLWIPITNTESAASAGYIKSIFYFYQTVPFLTLGKNTAEAAISAEIQPVIVTILSFAPIAVFAKVCPFKGLTSIGKLIYQNSKLSLSLIALLFFVLFRMIYLKLYNVYKARKRQRNSEALSEIDELIITDEKNQLGSSFKIRMVIAALNIIIYNYVNISTLTFSLLSCTNVGLDRLVLYFDGNVFCGNWWQYFVGIIAIGYVVPFFLQVIVSRVLLDKDIISPKQFMLSYIFPLPMLIFFAYKHAGVKEIKHVFQRTNSHISITARDRPDLLDELDEKERLRALCLYVVEEPFIKKG